MAVNEYDAIIVGGGQNGLVGAAYFGRAGARTLVLEARDRVGGVAQPASPTIDRNDPI
jgi:phytoene dehydrogenase-like protein